MAYERLRTNLSQKVSVLRNSQESILNTKDRLEAQAREAKQRQNGTLVEHYKSERDRLNIGEITGTIATGLGITVISGQVGREIPMVQEKPIFVEDLEYKYPHPLVLEVFHFMEQGTTDVSRALFNLRFIVSKGKTNIQLEYKNQPIKKVMYDEAENRATTRIISEAELTDEDTIAQIMFEAFANPPAQTRKDYRTDPHYQDPEIYRS